MKLLLKKRKISEGPYMTEAALIRDIREAAPLLVVLRLGSPVVVLKPTRN